MAGSKKRGWLERMGLKGDPDPEDWVVVTQSSAETEAISDYVKRTLKLLINAGIMAEVKPYFAPDDNPRSAINGRTGPEANARVRLAVVVHQRDLAHAQDVLQSRPQAEPFTEEELTRLADEASQPPTD